MSRFSFPMSPPRKFVAGSLHEWYAGIIFFTSREEATLQAPRSVAREIVFVILMINCGYVMPIANLTISIYYKARRYMYLLPFY